MRAFVVELVKEGIELGLLLKRLAPAGRVASFFRVRCMRS